MTTRIPCFGCLVIACFVGLQATAGDSPQHEKDLQPPTGMGSSSTGPLRRPPETLRASELVGLEIHDHSGQVLGIVEDYLIDLERGRVVEVWVSAHAASHPGLKTRAIPAGAIYLSEAASRRFGRHPQSPGGMHQPGGSTPRSEAALNRPAPVPLRLDPGNNPRQTEPPKPQETQASNQGPDSHEPARGLAIDPVHNITAGAGSLGGARHDANPSMGLERTTNAVASPSAPRRPAPPRNLRIVVAPTPQPGTPGPPR